MAVLQWNSRKMAWNSRITNLWCLELLRHKSRLQITDLSHGIYKAQQGLIIYYDNGLRKRDCASVAL